MYIIHGLITNITNTYFHCYPCYTYVLYVNNVCTLNTNNGHLYIVTYKKDVLNNI